MKSRNIRQFQGFPGWLGLCIAVIGLVGIVPEPMSHAEEKVQAILVVPDVLASPGKPARLEARLLQQGLLGSVGLGGENVVFRVGRQIVGTALTGGDGRAFLEYSNAMRGNLIIEAALEGSPRVVAEKARGVFAVWERRRPILLVDLETLLPEGISIPLPGMPTLPLQLGLQGVELPDPVPEARHALTKLASFYYNVVYVNRRGLAPTHTIQEWLHAHDFPLGVTRTIQSSREALKGLIEELKAGGWDNVEAGIGKDADFAQVLVKHRIRTVILSKTKPSGDFPRRTKFAENWTKVRKHL